MNIKGLFLNGFDEFRTSLEKDFDEYRTDFAGFDAYRTSFEGFDEYRTDLDSLDEIKTTPKKKSKKIVHITTDATLKIEDDFLEYLIFAYEKGIEAVNEMLTSNLEVNEDEMYSSITLKTAGKTYLQRINEYFLSGDTEAIMRVAETEYHRVFNEAILNGGISAGAKTKTWSTMLDDKVRETHDYLEGVTVPIDEEFYTYDGDHAKVPSGFENAENNVNCRCYIKLK